MSDMGFLGYVECKECNKYHYVNSPEEIKIWYHPDDTQPLAEVNCSSCGSLIQQRIGFDHMANFKMRGCSISNWNDRFEDNPLTEEMIDEWDEDKIGAELEEFYALS